MKINIIHPDEAKKVFNRTNCEANPFVTLDAKDFEIDFFDVTPIDGYTPTEGKNGEKFPFCCAWHTNVHKGAEEWFEKFPDCCDKHRKLIHVKWFNKTKYIGVVEKISKQLSYTQYHISRRIVNEDWYKDITDYIQYNINSFGQLPSGYGNPVGLHLYLINLKQWITKTKFDEAEFPKEKRKKIISYIDNLFKINDKGGKSTDLNLLYVTYRKWLDIFPFDIEYFEELREALSKKFPVIDGEISHNPYTNLSSGKIITKKRLVEVLFDFTVIILKKVDTKELIQKKLLSDTNRYKMDIISQQHRLKQIELLEKFDSGEKKYVTILKKWLNNEKEFIKEITPLIQNACDIVTSTVHSIDFTQLSGYDFERLVFEYVYNSSGKEYKVEWVGQCGKDNGVDIWSENDIEKNCYQCANYKTMKSEKGIKDIIKLVKAKRLPDRLIIVCGGKVSDFIKRKIKEHAIKHTIKVVEVWSGPEFEARLRKDSPDLIKRFFWGIKFP